MKKEILFIDHVKVNLHGKLLLNNFTLRIFEGEIVGIIFGDDAGKKQLIDLICNDLPFTYGRIYFNERLVSNYKLNEAKNNKIYLIQEKSSLIDDLTVADNIFVMRKGFHSMLINQKVINSQTRMLLEEFSLHIDPKKKACFLTLEERCIVEMMRAYIAGCALIVACDLSNFLPKFNLDHILELMRHYCEMGISFLYLDRYQFIFKVSDRAAFFSLGRVCKIFRKEEMNEKSMQPFTSKIDLPLVRNPESGNYNILEIKQVYTEHLKDFTLSVCRGECIVLYEAGNQALLEIKKIMLGACQPEKGEIYFESTRVELRSLKKRLGKRLGVIEDNPTQNMLFYNMTYLENLCYLLCEKKPERYMQRKYKKSIILEYKQRIGNDIYKNNITELELISLYKLVYYQMHLLFPKLLICVNPFGWGDLSCKKTILGLIQELKAEGITIVILSSDFYECLEVADRFVVLENGRIKREYGQESFSHLRKAHSLSSRD